MASDPTYVKAEVAENPTWELAWTIAQIVDDEAPIGWSKHISTATCLLGSYEMRRKMTLDGVSIPKPEAPADTDGWEWCLLEVMGHRAHWGRAREEERFGAKMIRVDVPTFKKPKSQDANAPLELDWATHYYGGSSIFSYTLTDEATVMQKARPRESPYRLSIAPPRDDDDDEIGFDG